MKILASSILISQLATTAVLLWSSSSFTEASTSDTTTTPAAASSIVDLSLPEFPPSPFKNTNPGAQQVIDLAKAIPELRTLLVLEHGHVVADYTRDDIVVDNIIKPFPIWSITKSWLSLIVGMMVQEDVLDLDESLGDIFDQDDESLWQNMTEAEFRQAVTVRELLTMSSGLGQPPEDKGNPLEWYEGGTMGGASLREALQGPPVRAEKKTFFYVDTNNVLSYAVAQRTKFATPREYLAARVFPFLGIANDEIGWWRNKEGMEYSFHGMLMTPTQLAKLGQLYLQGGKSNATHQLIREEWITKSLSPLQESGGNDHYGFLWWVYDGERALDRPDLGTIYCASGIDGQDVCLSSATDRVVVQQRDIVMDGGFFDDLSDVLLLPLTPSVRFDAAAEEEQELDLDEESSDIMMSAAPVMRNVAVPSFLGVSTILLLSFLK